MENFFPHCGNLFSIVWKNRSNLFHCVEKPGVRKRAASPRSGGAMETPRAPDGRAGRIRRVAGETGGYLAAAFLRSIAAARDFFRMAVFLRMMPCLTPLSRAALKAR
jgi:hypothetical protein